MSENTPGLPNFGPGGQGLSSQEKSLLQEQVSLLRGARGLAEEQRDLFSQLQPILFGELGLVRSEDAGRPNPEFQRISEELGRTPPTIIQNATSFTRAGDLRREQRTVTNPRFVELNEQLRGTPQTLQGTLEVDPRLQNLRETFLTGFENQFTNFFQQQERLQPRLNEIEERFAERTLASLRGELPVNPALLSDLSEREANLNESLRRQFGPGFASTTGAQESLNTFGQLRSEALEGARRGDLSQATGLLNQQQAGRAGTLGTIFGLNPNQAFSGGPLAAVGATGNPAIQSFLGTAQGFNAPLGTLFNTRALAQQADIERAKLQQEFFTEMSSAIAAGFAASSITKKIDKGALDNVLERLRHVPVRKWQYRPNEDLDVLDHAGPYAEDIHEHFGVGDGFHLYWVDMVGILLGAVKELDAKVHELKKRLDDG